MKRQKYLLILIILTLCAFIFLVVEIWQNGFIKKEIKTSGKDTGVKYSTSVIPKNVQSYLMSQEDISKTYGEKNIVIYYTGQDYPFAKELTNTVESLKEKYSDTYFFHEEIYSGSKVFSTEQGVIAYIDFKNMCGEFCIVNPEKNKLLKIEGMNADKISKISEILEQFKNR